jgi:murein DD-endopeptidase MepM/ murein hydrolase activator NlpD
MQIIVMHSRFSCAQSVTLTPRHLSVLGLVFVMIMLGGAFLLNFLAISSSGSLKLPFISEAMASQDGSSKQQEKYLKHNLTMMAIKLGEMQAQIARLDALGERVQGLAGVKPEEFNFKEMPGRGGLEGLGHEFSMSELQKALDALSKDMEHRADYLNVVESSLMNDKIKSKLLPTILPVNVGYNASGFGWRVDPVSGHSAFHEGIDFSSPSGTPIVSAAGGVVIAAEYHSEFGNMLEIDHGNDIFTRYAHASRLMVRVGDIVKRGQHVADIGSTGRSTGSHLHFEVRVKGVAQNPHKFLSAGGAQAKLDILAAN